MPTVQVAWQPLRLLPDTSENYQTQNAAPLRCGAVAASVSLKHSTNIQIAFQILVDSVRWRGVGASVFLIHSTNFQHAFYSCVDSLRWRRVRVPVCLRHSTIPRTYVSTVYRLFRARARSPQTLVCFWIRGRRAPRSGTFWVPTTWKMEDGYVSLIHVIETFENSIWLNI